MNLSMRRSSSLSQEEIRLLMLFKAKLLLGDDGSDSVRDAGLDLFPPRLSIVIVIDCSFFSK